MDHVAGEVKFGQCFIFEGEKFARIKMIGCGSIVKIDEDCLASKILAVSLGTHDLIVLDTLDAQVCLLDEYLGISYRS